MSWKDNCPRPYYKNYERIQIMSSQNWFEVYKLPGNVFAIAEPYHCQEVNSYLIIGDERALLFDTGEGFFDITEVAKELYKGEIIAANSHSHFDHIGCNYMFNTVLAFDDSQSRYTAERGAPHELFEDQLSEEMFLNGYPKELEAETFFVPPYHSSPLKDGEVIALGNRNLEVIHTPGHCSDSIMLFDRKNGILFTGDTFYMATLYAHFDCPEFGKSDLAQYAASLEKVAALGDDLKALYCSHNEFIVEPDQLSQAAKAFRQIIDGELKSGSLVDVAHVYLEEESKIAEYIFDGFSIICRT
ncbi:MAG: MBL fold metallo-hydrolase [Clostridia bacterium]|nr:MBL fold metallo-hydrolase [Clostridia bacterium]